jgi:colanic acid biosynthesis glycosyl transferase WcaI
MRILIHGINFAPELTGIGKYTGEFCFYLASQGHDIRVVTSPPYYPYWRVLDNYDKRFYQKEKINGVEIIRCPLWIPRNLTFSTRLLHLSSFALTSLPIMLMQIFWNPDVVIGIAPALIGTPSDILIAYLTGRKSWLHVQDFELDAAINLSIFPQNGLVQLIIKGVESFIFKRFDRVSTISKKMQEKLIEKGVLMENCVYFPNWVDTKSIYPMPNSVQLLRKDLGISDEQVVVLYSGNLGRKQGLKLLIDVVKLLKEDTIIHFIICGEGELREFIECEAIKLPNLTFLPLQPYDHLNALLNLANIHVLPQRPEAADLVMPSKLVGMLASGRVVVATAEANTELAEVVNEFGCVVPPGNAEELGNAIRKLSGNRDLMAELGMKGRDYVVKHWDINKVLGEFQKDLINLVYS